MNSLRLPLQSTALAGLLALAPGAVAPVQTQSYAQKTRLVRAAVLVLDGDKLTSTAYPQTGAPYAFYNLDNAQGIKPGGWTFVNPFAPGIVTEEIFNRYNNNQDPTRPLTLQPLAINKRSAAYWTVRMSDLSDAQIASYDVLLVAPRYRLSLNTKERERLRRFVDNGGTLWVDLFGAGAIDPENNLPLALQRTPNAAGNAYRDVTSPVLDGPRRVTGGDLDLLTRTSGFAIEAVPAGGANAQLVPLNAEFRRYRPVASVGPNNPVIAEARLGDGTIVVTARGAAQLLNKGAAPFAASADVSTSNLGYLAKDPILNAAGRAAARLGVNIVAMSGGFRQPAGGARKLGSASLDPGSPVLSRFVAETNGPYGPQDVIKQGVPMGAPVTYKGFLVATVKDVATDKCRVVVFDAVPGRDLDGDGDTDDGIVTEAGAVRNDWRDVSIGKPLDVVWASEPVDAVLSSPVCAEVPEVGANSPVDQVLVTDAVGNLRIYDLSLRSSRTGGYVGGTRLPKVTVAPVDNVAGTGWDDVVNPPTVYDGIAYMADTTSSGLGGQKGRIWTVDLSTGARRRDTTTLNDWYVGGPDAAGVPMPAFTASPTIGYIPIQDSTGGLDRVLYAPGVVNPGTPNTQPAFVSLWLGAKGEKPRVEVNGGTLKIITRAGTNGQLPIFFPTAGDSWVMKQMAPHLSITRLNGDPEPLSNWILVGSEPKVGGPGEVLFTVKPGLTQTDFDNVNVRIDYAVDWGNDPKNLSGQIVRGRLLLPVNKTNSSGPNQRILGPIALTGRGTLHMIQGQLGDAPRPPKAGATTGYAINDAGVGGTYWAMREDAGRGSFRVVSRFTLYKKYNQTFGAVGQSYAVPQVLEDADFVLRQPEVPAFIRNDTNFGVMQNFRFAGGVAVRNGVVYASINANRGSFNIPVAMVAAFRAEPETPEIRLGSSLGTNPRLVQADFARSNPNDLVRTPTSSTLPSNSLNVDAENGIIRLENLATVNREEITDCISLSQPVGIGSDGRAFVLRYPEANGDRWSPLLWFGLWNVATAKGAPLVAGNEVFMAADTQLLGYLGLSGAPVDLSKEVTKNAVVWSIDADVPTTGTFAIAQPSRPWVIQQAQLTLAPFEASPYYRMPQNRGATGFNEWKTRLSQTKMGISDFAGGVAGGDGTVAGFGAKGLYGMSRADFIVADEGRLLRVDSAGNPISNAFGSLFSGIGGGGAAAEIRPLVRPVKAYPVGTNEFLVVDAGANRVVRLGEDGKELRSIDRMVLDPEFKPTAYRPNEPLTFKDPRDVATYEGYVYKANGVIASGQNDIEYWVRYIVADAGNGRIVELADRYAVNGTTGQVLDPVVLTQKDVESGVTLSVPQVGVLTWQSPSLEQATKIGDYYHSISRVYLGDATSGRYVYVAGVGRTKPTRSAAGLELPSSPQKPAAAAGGAVVLFDPTGGVRVFDRFQMPDLSTTPFFNEKSASTTDKFDLATGASRPPQDNRPFAGVNAVTASTFVYNSEVSVRVMVSDADAVYEFAINSAILADPDKDPTQSANGTGALTPVWMINEAAYTALHGDFMADAGDNPRYFRPAYARRLDSGDVVVVNSYRGIKRNADQTYSGGVTVLDGLNSYAPGTRNLGFLGGSLRFELPPLTGIRGIMSPVFADRR